jgi:hypothetical protein
MDTLKKALYVSILLLASYSSHAQASKVNITSFTADKKANKLSINWSTDGTVATNYFEVQKSDDGNTFKTIAVVMGPDPRKTGDAYDYAENEKDEVKKPVYIRLCHVGTNGDEQITKIIQL